MPAAAAPSTSWRSAPRKNGRSVSRATSPPPTNAATAARPSARPSARPFCTRNRYGSSGMSAPTANVTSDAAAAVYGEGSSRWSTPSSSRTCTSRAWSGWAEICAATLSASSGSTPCLRNVAASSRRSESGLCSSSWRSLRTSASTSSFCEETETYSPVAMENAPAASPASPVSTMRCAEPPEAFTPAPTPAISETLVTRPSMAPNTAGRSQPPETSLCWCPCASCCSLISTDMVGFPGVCSGARWPAHRWQGTELPCPQPGSKLACPQPGSKPLGWHHYSLLTPPSPGPGRAVWRPAPCGVWAARPLPGAGRRPAARSLPAGGVPGGPVLARAGRSCPGGPVVRTPVVRWPGCGPHHAWSRLGHGSPRQRGCTRRTRIR